MMCFLPFCRSAVLPLLPHRFQHTSFFIANFMKLKIRPLRTARVTLLWYRASGSVGVLEGQSDTHTHTHTHRAREREGGGKLVTLNVFSCALWRYAENIVESDSSRPLRPFAVPTCLFFKLAFSIGTAVCVQVVALDWLCCCSCHERWWAETNWISVKHPVRTAQ